MSNAGVADRWFGPLDEPADIGLAPERRRDVVRHELRDLPLNGFPLALQPYVVPRPSFRELLGATAGLVDLLRRAVLGSAGDRAGRMAAIGVDPADCPWFTDDEDFELRHCADLARADVVVGPDGPRFVEFNVSGAFGGLWHFRQFQRAWLRIREEAGRPAFVSVDPLPRMAALVERACAEAGRALPSVALIGTPREWGPLTGTRPYDIQVDALRQHGVHAVHLDFEELLDGLGLPGRLRHPIGLAQFTDQDAAALGYDTGPAAAAAAAGLRLLPSQTAWLLHSKKTLARVSEGLPWMTAADRDLAARYLPWTRVVGDRKVDWHGARHDLPRLLVERQEQFVLKGATGCSGDEVVFGGRTGPAEWAALVQDAVRTGYPVAQEVVESVVVPIDVMHESGEIERIRSASVISPFCVDGVGAGCFARFLPAGPPGVISALSAAMLTCLVAEA